MTARTTTKRILPWLRTHLFNSPFNSAVTLLLLLGIWAGAPAILDWMLFDSVWRTDDPALCRQAIGACWAVIGEKYRLILFGLYPHDAHWRGALVVILLLALLVGAAVVRRWTLARIITWMSGLLLALILQAGGIAGLAPVGTDQWSGLPLTLLLFMGTLILGTPAGILLALGRRSRQPFVRHACAGYIEFIRGVPLVNILFMSTLILPLFLPSGVSIDKLLRVQLGIALCYAAYCAEVLRGGLQAIGRGQYEAAEVLGLGYWHTTTRIVLPQALRIAAAPLVNEIIRAFKNTSVLAVIGLFDVLGATMAALEDPSWSAYYVEAYLMVFALYLAFCWPLSRYGRSLETELRKGERT